MDGAFPSEKGQAFEGGYGRGGPGRGGPDFGDGGRGFRGTAENAKTKLCTRWMAGECRFGDRCNFAHGEEELRRLPPRDDFGAPAGRGYGPPGRGYGPPRGGYGGRGPMGGYGRGRGYDDGYGGGYGGYPPHGGGYGGYPPEHHGGHHGYGPPMGGPGPGGPPMRGPEGPGGPPGARPPAGMSEDAWAAQGYPVQGPNGWVMYRTKDTGEYYYHNYNNSSTQWERPADWPAGM